MALVQKELQNAYIGEYVEVTSLTLDKSYINLTTVGQTEQITATTVPAGATVTWSSSDTTIATVSNTGLVTCVTPGDCTITATSFGVTATCSVTNATFMYSYDFTTGSVADLQSKGWTVPTGSSVTTNGYKNTSNNRSYIKLSSSQLYNSAQNATKLVMKFHWAGTGHTERVLSIMQSNTEICNLYGNYVANSATFGKVAYVNESISEYGQNGDFTTTFTIDIQNKTWEYVSTGHTTLTGTVTDASIASFKTSDGIGLYFQGSGYIKDMSISIA